ncbi:unnamed protein product [Rotaria magnacalcarata]|uniref:EGF-like domain-containing protein n=2 Tax=Rotaria magnacalcarata TaxID=392030 RepID=A0A820A617_9BILA|nr:unnamed protein product [Rotaria magnacalcarata]
MYSIVTPPLPPKNLVFSNTCTVLYGAGMPPRDQIHLQKILPAYVLVEDMECYGQFVSVGAEVWLFVVNTCRSCNIKNGDCDPNAACSHDDVTNAVKCTCKAGYTTTGSAVKIVCKDTCTIKNGGCAPDVACSHDATTNAVKCTCKPGYTNTGSDDNMVCKEICTVNNGDCDRNAICSHDAKTNGVKCTCKTGYTNSGSGVNVVCTDSCAVNNGACDRNAACSHDAKTNAVTCTCKAGYTNTGSVSKVVCTDSCTVKNGGCVPNAGCSHDEIPYQPTANQTKEPCFYGKCSSTGDPHLIPFASSYGGSQTSYWYQVQGWSLLIGNSFVTLYILSAASPYLVTNYVLIFHGASPCILIGNSKSPPMCANTTSATSTTLSAGSSWTHFHNTKCIVVHVDYQGGYYDFHIYHSYTLINLSAGQCQQTHGRIEGASKASLSVIPEVCNIFIAAAKKRAVGAINPNVIKMAQTSCVNDLQTSLDTTIAVAGISLVLHDSASSQLDSDDQTGLFHQIHALKHDAFLNATQEANELISNTKELCNEKNQCLGSANNINH